MKHFLLLALFCVASLCKAQFAEYKPFNSYGNSQGSSYGYNQSYSSVESAPRSVKAYYVANGEWHIMRIKVKHISAGTYRYWTICERYDNAQGWMLDRGTVEALTQYDPVELRQLFTHKGYLQGIGTIYFEL